MDLFSASLSDIWVILKGTNFDITGLKSSSYMIIDNKTADTGPSTLATLCAVSPSNTIDSTNKASAAVANNANPLLPSNSIAFFGLPCLLTASKSDDEDEVLHTLPT
ncbi:hypothetical protein Moror_12048 [Moniliophthora roreri MCA 2997]|uniref:Uncharacterized protein n=1 Tax=Moniliophthora roreri (strain MCA 2997) TaxID=1381753 RepID=V2XW59_MONRO|nr:hypothetical protein Moror_12048 [Moniliophthora roreri MCA 2997]